MIPTNSGRHLLMYNGYTFSKQSKNCYYCSKKDQGCRARVRLDTSGAVLGDVSKHNHLPPVYEIYNGKYLRVG